MADLDLISISPNLLMPVSLRSKNDIALTVILLANISYSSFRYRCNNTMRTIRRDGPRLVFLKNSFVIIMFTVLYLLLNCSPFPYIFTAVILLGKPHLLGLPIVQAAYMNMSLSMEPHLDFKAYSFNICQSSTIQSNNSHRQTLTRKSLGRRGRFSQLKV